MNKTRKKPETKKRGRGRPVTYVKEYRDDILLALERYIDEEDIPIVADFACKHKIPRQRLYEWPELSDSLKRLGDKREAAYERLMVSSSDRGVVSGCIFALKNMGWRDQHEIDAGSNLLEALRRIQGPWYHKK